MAAGPQEHAARSSAFGFLNIPLSRAETPSFADCVWSSQNAKNGRSLGNPTKRERLATSVITPEGGIASIDRTHVAASSKTALFHSLHEFILANRERIVLQARQRVRARLPADSVDTKFEHGVPIFLGQLLDALAPQASGSAARLLGPGYTRKQIIDSATLHGQALVKGGFTVAQVVHGYGDICQVVTELAGEMDAPISTDDFQVFNRCLDDAIAGAVTAFARQRERDLTYAGTERLGMLAHELRNMLHTAILSFDAIKKGTVGMGGSTGAIHARSLAGLRMLVERSLAEVRLEAGGPSLERISMQEFIEEIEVTATMLAEGYGVRLSVQPVSSDLSIDADGQLLASAVSNLLQNAFKFTRAEGRVSLACFASAGRVLIEVSDECGGLPPGKAEELFEPFTRASSDHSGLGLGLSIAMSAVRANAGDLRARDVPGHGCVFTIDLPRRPTAASTPPPTAPEPSERR